MTLVLRYPKKFWNTTIYFYWNSILEISLVVEAISAALSTAWLVSQYQ